MLSVFLISSCEEGGGDGGGTPTPEPDDPLDAQAALLNGNWSVKDVNSVTKDGTIVDVFTTMTLSFSGGTKNGGNYSTSHNEPSGTEVWPTQSLSFGYVLFSTLNLVLGSIHSSADGMSPMSSPMPSITESNLSVSLMIFKFIYLEEY